MRGLGFVELLGAPESDQTRQAVGATDMGLLKGDAHMAWMNQLDRLDNALRKMDEAEDIDELATEYWKLKELHQQEVTIKEAHDAHRQAATTTKSHRYPKRASFAVGNNTIHHSEKG